MGFWDMVRAAVDKMSPQVKMETHDIRLNPPPEVLSARSAARLARLEAALAAGDRRGSVVDEINQIKQGHM